MGSFDLNSLRATSEEGAVMELVDLGGKIALNSKDDPITITLLSTDSTAYKAAIRKGQNDLLNKKQRRANTQVDVEVIEKISRRARAAVTIAWSEGFVLDGIELECTEANALMIYEAISEVDEQVSEFITDRVNFTKVS